MTRLTRLLLLLPLFVAACGERDEIVVYETTPVAGYDWPNTARTPAKGEGMVWEVPAGWVAAPDVDSALVADYRFEGATQSLPGRVTLSTIAGDGGGLEANIERWRGQLFAVRVTGPTRGETVSELFDLRPGIQARQVVIRGQDQGPFVPDTMVATIVTFRDASGRPILTWFFKLTGDRATVLAAEPAYTAMLQSFQPDPELVKQLMEMEAAGRGVRGEGDGGASVPAAGEDGEQR